MKEIGCHLPHLTTFCPVFFGKMFGKGGFTSSDMVMCYFKINYFLCVIYVIILL